MPLCAAWQVTLVVSDFTILWTVAHQVPFLHGVLLGQEYWMAAMSSSRGSFLTQDRTHISYIPALAGGLFNHLDCDCFTQFLKSATSPTTLPSHRTKSITCKYRPPWALSTGYILNTSVYAMPLCYPRSEPHLNIYTLRDDMLKLFYIYFWLQLGFLISLNHILINWDTISQKGILNSKNLELSLSRWFRKSLNQI